MELLAFIGKTYPFPDPEPPDIITDRNEYYKTEYVQLEGISGLLTITLTVTTQDAFPS